MINRIFLSYFFAVMVFVSVLPFGVLGQDKEIDGRDFAELIEMELSDLKQKNARLATELSKLKEEKLKNANQENSGGKKEIKRLMKENSLLKAEIIKLDKTIKEITASNKKAASEVETLKRDLNAAKAASASKGDNAAGDKDIIDRCRRLEDENQILKSEVDERKDIEAQRKEAFDNLFKDLAEIKRDLKKRDAEIEALKSKTYAGEESTRAKENELDAAMKRIEKMQAELDGHSDKVRELNETITKEKDVIAAKDQELKKAMAERQSVEAELNRIKLTDGQRKKTMDDVLTKLATSENLNRENSAKIQDLENRLRETVAKTGSESEKLNASLKTAEDEVAHLRQELKAVTEARDALESKVRENNTVAQRDTARIVELEGELARMKATDNQRKKSMDKLLLEISSLEDKQNGRRDEIAAARRDAEKLHAEVARLKDKLEAANKKIAVLKKNKKGTAVADTAELTELKKRNKELNKTIAELKDRLNTAASGSAGKQGGDESEALAARERDKLIKEKAGLEQQIKNLQKTSSEQLDMLNSLKSDLKDVKSAKEKLTKQVEQLRNRKIDVRESDLFKELEQMNVTLREKIVQTERERQRLAKSVKKMEKRDERFDDDIEHEKSLRKKYEKELADARAKELEYQELIERLMAQIPELEAQITELSDKAEKTQNLLTDREEDLRAMKAELEKREHRLIKAERVASVLRDARSDIIHESDKEKLDMYYNMAAVYAREGKFKEAEQQYLHALRINPLDADVHYNLGILYDDELKSPEKAISHYRRYLSLNPHGPDADEVRNWLMKLEMNKKR